MATIECDDLAMERALRAHADLLLEQGGTIAPGVVIRSRNGEISVAHPSPPPDGPIITVPDASLVRMVDGVLSLEGDDIVPGSEFANLPENQQSILAAQSDVYNLGQKIGKTRDRVPKIYYQAAPELLTALLTRRLPGENPDAAPVIEPPDVLTAFLGSRLLSWRESGAPARTSEVLMSLIDYFDHHPSGTRYDALASPALLSVSAARCGTPHDACFINYHAGDPHAMFIQHGFVDTNTFFTRLPSFDMELPEIGLIRIKPGRPRRGHANRKESDRERAFPTPVLRSTDTDSLEVSNLVIKRIGNRSVLRRGLGIALLEHLQGHDQTSINRVMDRVEWEILQRTRSFYAGLRNLAMASTDAVDPAPVLALCEHQDAVINAYIEGMAAR